MQSFIIAVLFTFAASTSCIAQRKPAFTYPANIADTAKKAFVKEFNQGQVLYNLSCGKCHTQTIAGKQVIPDFSLPQLMDYELRMYPQHEEKLDDKHLRDEEMVKIVTFLRYKARTGVYITPQAKQP